MYEVTLLRTCNRPLKFRGELTASANTWLDQGPQDRWFVLSLYRTDSLQYVLYVSYRSNYDVEFPTDHAFVTQSIAEAVEVLRTEIPDQLHRDVFHTTHTLRQRYDQAVTELLSDVEPEEL